MNRKVSLTKPAYENLVKQLVELDEARDEIVRYTPDHNRNELLELIDEYIKRTETVLKETRLSDEASDHFPYAAIGSDLVLEDMETGGIYNYQLVAPYQSELVEEHISCLSPLGRNLLLKEVGDVVEVKVPAGEYRYKVKSIILSRGIGQFHS